MISSRIGSLIRVYSLITALSSMNRFPPYLCFFWEPTKNNFPEARLKRFSSGWLTTVFKSFLVKVYHCELGKLFVYSANCLLVAFGWNVKIT
jgi:hypothetical protein